MNGHGFCLFRCIAAQANLSNVDDVDVRLLAACVFAQVVLTVPRDFIDDTDEEMAERRKDIDQIPEYQHAACMGVLDAFDIHILDHMEGVLKGNLSKSRRYASLTDIMALLEHLRLTCILLEPHKWEDAEKWRLWLPDDKNEVMDNDIQPGCTDLLLVHHERPDHFDSVKGSERRCWTIAANKVQRVRDAFNACINDCPMFKYSILNNSREHLRPARL